MKTGRVVLAIGASMVVLISGCERAPQSRAVANASVRIQREWIPNAEFAGDLLARSFAKQKGVVLTILSGSETSDPVRMIDRGNAEIGVASAHRILAENEGGRDYVVLAVATNPSPVTFVSRAGVTIREPKDLLQKRVGIQPGTNTELIFDGIVHANRLDVSKIDAIDSGWNGPEGLLRGDIDVLAVFDYDEPVTLRRRGLEVTAERVLRPSEWGCEYIGTVYFARRAYVNSHRDLVEATVGALVQGWKATISNPDSATAILCRENADLDPARERESLRRLIPYLKDPGSGWLLYAPEKIWLAMADSLRSQGKLRGDNPLNGVDYSFLMKTQ